MIFWGCVVVQVVLAAAAAAAVVVAFERGSSKIKN